MALTVNPAVSGGRRKWALHTLLFGSGVFLGGLTSVLGVAILVALAAGILSESVVVGIIAAALVWAALADLGLQLPLPYLDRQVPEWFRDVLPQAAVALSFGAMLGTGFFTMFTYSAHATMLLLLAFQPTTQKIVWAIGLFALGKTLVLLVPLGTSSLGSVTELFRWTKAGTRTLKATTSGVTLVAAALVAIT